MFIFRDLKPNIDGKNVWNALSEDTQSDRIEILHNIDDIWGSAALTINEWKVIKGTNYKGIWDYWYGPSGSRDAAAYNAEGVLQCPTGKALHRMKMSPTIDSIKKLREEANINCSLISRNSTIYPMCQPLIKPCLFNVQNDPCEQFNLADK